MPYRSEAQRKKFHSLLKQGKISAKVVAEFDKASKGKKLPKRIKPKKAKRKGA
jgi:hypothetical protein